QARDGPGRAGEEADEAGGEDDEADDRADTAGLLPAQGGGKPGAGGERGGAGARSGGVGGSHGASFSRAVQGRSVGAGQTGAPSTISFSTFSPVVGSMSGSPVCAMSQMSNTCSRASSAKQRGTRK